MNFMPAINYFHGEQHTSKKEEPKPQTAVNQEGQKQEPCLLVNEDGSFATGHMCGEPKPKSPAQHHAPVRNYFEEEDQQPVETKCSKRQQVAEALEGLKTKMDGVETKLGRLEEKTLPRAPEGTVFHERFAPVANYFEEPAQV